MKNLLIISFSFFCLNAYATNYYFANSGDDNNAGTSSGSPWLTLSKFNSVFASKSPGDNFLFNRGDIFYGSMIISRSGSAGLPMTIGTYGTGANPVITGFVSIVPWTNLGSNIWESTFAISTLNSCNMVVINGVNTPMGRFPNTGYLTYQSSTTTTKISSSLNSAVTNWTGAQLVVRLTNWLTDRDTITAHSGGTITHTYHSAAGAGANGFGLFIQNDVRTLDAQNEWYYNPSTQKLRMYSTTMPTNVQISTIDTLLNSTARDYFTIDGIDFTGSNKITLCIPGSQNVTIQNCHFDYTGYDMLWGAQNFGGAGAPGLVFQNNTVNHTNNNAITLAGEFTNPYVGHNTFLNTGCQAGMGGYGYDQSFGTDEVLQMRGDNSIIEYNTIIGVGYIGINTLANRDSIRFNLIKHIDSVKMDGGAIYSWNGNPGATTKTGNAIYNNIIDSSNGLSAIAGTPGATPLVHGIYLDANSRYWNVYNNTIANQGSAGIYNYSGSSHNNYHNNTCFNNGVTQILITNQFANGFSVISDTVQNNIFFAKTATELTGKFTTRDALSAFTDSMGVFTNNIYARPIDDNLTILTISNGSVGANDNLATWQTVSRNDVGSVKCPKNLTDTNNIRLYYNPTSATKTSALDAKYIDVKNVAYNGGTLTLPPFTSVVLINNGALAVTNTSPVANANVDQNITLPVSSVTLSGAGTDADGSIASYLWTKISGPGTGTITNPSLASTTFTGLSAGTYLLQLTVTDNLGATATDNMQIVVNPANILPVVNAGSNVTITLPTSSASLTASASDADGTIVSYAWSKISGPSCTITSPAAASTSITGITTAGIYTFQVLATDNSGGTATSTVLVTVNIAANILPVSNAGNDVSITLPINTVSLAGSGTDADGTIASYLWTQVSGASSTITSPTTASTSITGLLTAGTYVFQLRVTDNSGATAIDNIIVTVVATPVIIVRRHRHVFF